MPKLSTWFKTELTAIESLIESDAKQLAVFMSAIYSQVEPLLKTDVLTILKDGLPVVIAALSGGAGAAFAAAEGVVKAAAPTLEQEATQALAAALTAQAKAVTPITTIPSA